MNLTRAELVSLLNYDPQTGVFRWAKRRFGTRFGSEAGAIDPTHGYRRIKINGALYLAHRLAWLYVNGEWPESEIDHIDRNRANNSIANLRKATRSENQRNKPTYRNNQSGCKGVHWHKQHRKYVAVIQHQKRRIHLGLFRTLEDAANAYRAAAASMHGVFAAQI